MRECARLLIHLRRLKPSLSTLSEFLCPGHFDCVVAAVRAIAGDGSEDLEDVDGLRHPSVALKLGHNLQKLCTIKMVIAIKEGDETAESEAKNFITLLNADWSGNVSAPALSTMHQRRFSKVQELPKSDDVEKFSSFLDAELNKVIRELKCDPLQSRQLYKRCQHLTLAKLTVFNKRRPGEVEQLR